MSIRPTPLANVFVHGSGVCKPNLHINTTLLNYDWQVIFMFRHNLKQMEFNSLNVHYHRHENGVVHVLDDVWWTDILYSLFRVTLSARHWKLSNTGINFTTISIRPPKSSIKMSIEVLDQHFASYFNISSKLFIWTKTTDENSILKTRVWFILQRTWRPKAGFGQRLSLEGQISAKKPHLTQSVLRIQDTCSI